MGYSPWGSQIVSFLTNDKFRSKGIRNNKRVTLMWQRAALSEIFVAKRQNERPVVMKNYLFMGSIVIYPQAYPVAM